MKMKSSTAVQNQMPVQQETTPEQFAAKKEMKKLEKEIAKLEQFEKTTKKEMQDRKKFNVTNSVRKSDKIEACEAQKAELRAQLIALQNRC